jgi:hypothetical protein
VENEIVFLHYKNGLNLRKARLWQSLHLLPWLRSKFASTKVEHAPNIPKNGMFKSRKPKLEEIH